MDRVARKKNTSIRISFGYHAASRPHACAEPFDLNRTPKRPMQIPFAVDGFWRDRGAGIEHHEAPHGIYRINHAHVRPHSTTIDRDEEGRRFAAANRQEVRGPEVQVNRM